MYFKFEKFDLWFLVIVLLFVSLSFMSYSDTNGEGIAISSLDGSYTGVVETQNEPAVIFSGNTITGMTYYAPNGSVSVVSYMYCGDGTCNNGETCSTCPNDCGVCSSPPPPPKTTPSGGGGAAGGAVIPTVCISEYVCGKWSECQENNLQQRLCRDMNKCPGSNNYLENKECIYEQKATDFENESIPESPVITENITNVTIPSNKGLDELEEKEQKEKNMKIDVNYTPFTLSLLIVLICVVLLFAVLVPLAYVRYQIYEERFIDYLKNPLNDFSNPSIQIRIIHHMDWLVMQIKRGANADWKRAYDLYEELVFCFGKLTNDTKDSIPKRYDFDALKYNLMFVSKNADEKKETIS